MRRILKIIHLVLTDRHECQAMTQALRVSRRDQTGLNKVMHRLKGQGRGPLCQLYEAQNQKYEGFKRTSD